MRTISLNQVYKQYGKKDVLKSLNLEIESGSVVGLLGKNGAGKTTLNRILTGLSFPSKGTVLICGEKPQCGSGKVSYLSENIAIFPYLSAAENLAQIYLMNGLKPDKIKIANILDQISIENSKKKASQFSLGMKRRLQIAMTILVLDREIVILDEPTNGLDLNGVIWLKEMLRSFVEQDRTLIITSHAINELEPILSHYAILAQGHIVDFGKTKEIANAGLLVKLKKEDMHKVVECLNQKTVQFSSYGEDSLMLLGAEESANNAYLKLLIENGVTPIEFSFKKQSLVDIFMSYSG